jgi:phosphohistidine swiveling domain-containing protein
MVFEKDPVVVGVNVICITFDAVPALRKAGGLWAARYGSGGMASVMLLAVAFPVFVSVTLRVDVVP